MPNKTEKKEVGGAEKLDKDVNEARMSFDAYKKRMTTGGFKTGSKDIKTGNTMSHPYVAIQPNIGPFILTPQPLFQLPPDMLPQQAQYSPQVPFSLPLGQSGKPLFNSLGNMLRLGIDLINTSLVGGLQLMEGFYGGSRFDGNSCMQCSCCCKPEPCNGYEQSSCCEPCDCCNPSVHNCC